MQPGEKTRAPLCTEEPAEMMMLRQLKLTVVFHPDRARIGASLKVGALTASGVLHLDVMTLGRNAPLFDDGFGLDEPHVSRRALMVRSHARGS